MQGGDAAFPACLEVGTEVSAKYRGAFCEAKVRNVVKQVKAKVSTAHVAQLGEGGFGGTPWSGVDVLRN